MQLSIVIVNWNTRDLLSNCLESIYAHPPRGDFEVLVVDNASKDGSAAVVAECFPQVCLIESAENLGFAAGNNLAIPRTQGRYVMLLNPDTEVRVDALERLVSFIEDNPAVGSAGPRLLNADGSLQESCYPAPTVLREFWRLFHLDRLYPHSKYPMQEWRVDQVRMVDVLKGACVVFRREVFDQVGLLDEDFFMYSEEVDLSYRVRRAGWKIAWAPQAEVVHYGGQSTQQVAREMFLQLYKGKVKYYRKNVGSRAVGMYKIVLFFAAIMRLLVAPAAILEEESSRQEHLTLASHYRRLLGELAGM